MNYSRLGWVKVGQNGLGWKQVDTDALKQFR